MKNVLILCSMLVILLSGCGGKSVKQQEVVTCDSTAVVKKSPKAQYLDSIGFLNIADVDTTIVIDLMYTRADNFVGEILYLDLQEAYLHPMAMESLVKANQLLKAKHPNYKLIVYDATRPLSAQQRMWDLVKGTDKDIYVSDPSNGGGLHNYGLAVDVNILDETGKPLSMGVPVDYLGIESHIDNEAQLVKEGKITAQDVENRKLLREIMCGAGFRTIASEWWHFNRITRDEARANYQLVL